MDRDQTITAVKEILQTIAPEQNLTELPLDANLQQTLEIDSYDFLNLMIRISKRFEIDIPEETYEKLGTLEGIVGYLDEQK
jgi:acyl carrier protein